MPARVPDTAVSGAPPTRSFSLVVGADTIETVTSRALAVSGAGAVVLYRLDAAAQILQPVAHAGNVPFEFTTGLELPVGQRTASSCRCSSATTS